jgi:sirohydrochlorin cobaltochelatase
MGRATRSGGCRSRPWRPGCERCSLRPPYAAPTSNWTLPTCLPLSRELIASGANHVTVVPMFLGTGRHAREDLPGLVRRVEAEHPGVVFVLQKPVGEDSRVLDLLAQIAME